jgi:hypothetical protein
MASRGDRVVTIRRKGGKIVTIPRLAAPWWSVRLPCRWSLIGRFTDIWGFAVTAVYLAITAPSPSATASA